MARVLQSGLGAKGAEAGDGALVVELGGENDVVRAVPKVACCPVSSCPVVVTLWHTRCS